MSWEAERISISPWESHAADVESSSRNMLLAEALPVPRERQETGTKLPDWQVAILAEGAFPKEHASLDAAAEQNLKDKDLKRFRENMDTFEKRVQTQGLDHAEVGKTYNAIERLLSSKTETPVSVKDKLKLAQQVLDQAANPREIDQGGHKTCSVTVVETRTYARTPGAAAKLVADVASTGSFTTADGRNITLTAGSMKPDREATGNPTSDGLRSFASQLFQITAVNIHWSRMLVSPDGRRVPAGSLRYQQDPSKAGPNEFGEQLMDQSQTPPKELYKQPFMAVGGLEYISNQVTGLNENNIVIEHIKHSGSESVTVNSAAELKKAVIEARDNNRLPVILRVHTANSPFSNPKGVWHVVSIVDVDEANGKYLIDNQWGRSNDRWVKQETLFRAMTDPNEKASMLPKLDSKKEAILESQ